MKTTLAILAAATLTLPAGAAQAESIQVSYRDLDLGSLADQTVLAHRIDKAAREVCGHKPGGTRNLRHDMATRACFEKAKAGAGEQVATRVNDQALGG